tara:strand:+ start:2059 stop:2172 length:114 start_codon:yes stop_codon:yes gene_type:complete
MVGGRRKELGEEGKSGGDMEDGVPAADIVFAIPTPSI